MTKIKQIKMSNGQVANPISGSSWTYSPYVPLQVSRWSNQTTKTQIPSIELYSINKQMNIKFATGKSYEFILNYAKMSRYEETTDYSSAYRNDEEYIRAAIRRQLYEFNIGQKIFISEITETTNGFYFISEHSNIPADDYDLTLVEVNTAKTFPFTASELIRLLEQEIVKEL